VNDGVVDAGREPAVALGWGLVAGVGAWRRSKCASGWGARWYRTLSPGDAHWSVSGNAAYNNLDCIEWVAPANGSGSSSSTVSVSGSGCVVGSRPGGNGVVGGQRKIGVMGWASACFG
jgi:hypothetical protein